MTDTVKHRKQSKAYSKRVLAVRNTTLIVQGKAIIYHIEPIIRTCPARLRHTHKWGKCKVEGGGGGSLHPQQETNKDKYKIIS